MTDTKYYLDARSRTLSPDAAAEEATATYDASMLPEQVSFVVTFAEETTNVGYPKAHLWVDAETPTTRTCSSSRRS